MQLIQIMTKQWWSTVVYQRRKKLREVDLMQTQNSSHPVEDSTK